MSRSNSQLAAQPGGQPGLASRLPIQCSSHHSFWFNLRLSSPFKAKFCQSLLFSFSVFSIVNQKTLFPVDSQAWLLGMTCSPHSLKCSSQLPSFSTSPQVWVGVPSSLSSVITLFTQCYDCCVLLLTIQSLKAGLKSGSSSTFQILNVCYGHWKRHCWNRLESPQIWR